MNEHRKRKRLKEPCGSLVTVGRVAIQNSVKYVSRDGFCYASERDRTRDSDEPDRSEREVLETEESERANRWDEQVKDSRDEIGVSKKAGLSEKRATVLERGSKMAAVSEEDARRREEEGKSKQRARARNRTNGIRRTKTRRDDSARDVEKEGQRKIAEERIGEKQHGVPWKCQFADVPTKCYTLRGVSFNNNGNEPELIVPRGLTSCAGMTCHEVKSIYINCEEAE
ncbi:uncharacterized protein LOC122538906 [Frieseomelitta varia]|uniref:uncharacterized protein LOC122538906 n=1 Tax=Frieseomelitta varia TaxID=561572 RepID=UPI001CB67F6C|nr:uncharacterized protein LOC122538906 [Frieseomelitta varia]